MATSKVFESGGSRAIRIPKEIQIPGDEVEITQVGSTIMIYPKGHSMRLLREAIAKTNGRFPARRQPRSVEQREPL
jgi:antitoxin VapB